MIRILITGALTIALTSSVALAQTAAEQAQADEAMARAQEAMQKLSARADEVSVRMLEQLDHRNPDKRKDAAEFLGMREEAGAVPGLIDLLSDPVDEVRNAAAAALWRIGKPDAAAARPELERVLANDSSGRVRINSAGALWTLGASTTDLIPRLEPVLSDRSGYSRVRAADMQRKMGVDADQVLPVYRRSMDEGDSGLRLYTIKLILDHDDTPMSYTSLLLDALADPDETIRTLAVVELSQLSEPDGEVISALQLATRDSSQYVRSTALEALGRVAPDSGAAPSPVVDDLLSGLSDRKPDVRVGAAQGLGEVKASSPAVIDALVAALGDKKDEVREAAADALGEIGAPAGQPAIPTLWGLWNDRSLNVFVRHAAGRALSSLGETVDWESEG